jgi:uncharacterized protein
VTTDAGDASTAGAGSDDAAGADDASTAGAGSDDAAGAASAEGGTNPQPTAPDERIVSLDILRGIAIFGILVINVQSFSLPSATRANPTRFDFFSGVDQVVWLFGHTFFEQKFISLFSIMFGAGIVLFMQSKRAGDRSGFVLHYRRTVALLAIGLGHAYLLWHGDILVVYALCALWSVLFWTEQPRRLFLIGSFLLAVPVLLNLVFLIDIGLSGTHESWLVSDEAIRSEIDAFRGGWTDGLSERVDLAVQAHTTGFIGVSAWRYTGLMLWGMAFYKSGLLTGDWSRGAYRRLILVGSVVGLALTGLGLWTVFAYDWSGGAGVFLWTTTNLGALFLAPAYAGVVMLYYGRHAAGLVGSACAAVGRTALSNYLFQTVVATTIFYGYGLGLFAQVSRVEQLAVVAGIWLVQIVLSVLWLRRYEYGPVEWLWRRVTYGRWR